MRISARVPWGMPLLRSAAVWISLFACAPHAIASPPAATTTTLAIASNGSPVTTLLQGNLVTLTAAVTSGSTPLTVGQVEFCDVTPSPGVPAPYCTDIHQLALAQLTPAGTATFHFVPPLGNRSYKAVFLGTTGYAGAPSYASSASSVLPLAVTQSSYQYLSATTLTSSGNPGSYTLTATVTGGSDPLAPSGTVSFLDTDNANYVLGTAPLTPLTSGLTFSNSEYLSVGGIPPGQILVADFNGDGIPDLAMVETNGSITNPIYWVQVALGNGDGTFNPAPGPFLTTPHSLGVTKVADVNGDGIPDLVMMEGNGSITNPLYWVQVALGNGDGTFNLLPPQSLPNPNSNSEAIEPGIYTVGDFKGDGKTDLVMEYTVNTLLQPDELWFFPGNGDGTFGPPVVAYQNPGYVQCNSLAVADFNGDGILDLACANQEVIIPNGNTNPPPGNLSVLLGNGDGTFHLGSNVLIGAGPFNVVVADFNGDGKADIATASFSPLVANEYIPTVSVALGYGDGTFAPSTSLPVSVNNQYAQILVVTGDFNGDGTPDLAVIYGTVGVAPATKLVTVYLGNGDGTFSANDVTLNSFIAGFINAAGDFNGDGRWDLALVRLVLPPGGPIGVYLSEPTSATATVTGISPVGTGIHLVDASYPGSAPVLSPSLSNTVGLEAEPAPTTLTLIAAPTTGLYQQPFTLVATLSPTTAQNHTPTGTVTFYNSGVPLGTVPLVNNAATLTVSAVLPAGNYNLTANYSGDTNFMPSTGLLQYLVSASPPPITFTVPNKTYGDPPFPVSATSSFPGAFTYSVLIGPATISGSTVTLTGAGTVVLQASQSTNGNVATQNAAFTVAKEAQTIAFAAPASPVSVGAAPVALSATASSGLPVTLSVLSGPATIAGSTLTFTGVGTVVVAADQAGNQNILAAPEVTHTIVVNKGLPVVTLTPSQNPAFLLNPVTLSATVSYAAATPTGSVVFSNGTAVLGTEPLIAGVASITLSTLPLGANSITAAYSGDGSYNPVTSSALNEAVQDFTLTVTGNPAQTIQYGAAATYALAVAPVDGPTIPSAISFAVSGAPTGSTITFAPATLAAGSTASNLTLTIQVPSVIAATQHRLRSPAPTLAALALIGLVLPFRRRLKLRGKFAGWIGCILLLLAGAGASAALIGCGPSIIISRVESFAVTVTATSGALSHATAASLTVQ
jgi:Bacterial Ig-like domain (group 3)/FG-GAP-like repeat